MAPSALMSGARPGARWLLPPWCGAEPSDSSPVRPPAYAPFTSEARAPATVRAWQALRHALETHRHQRTQRRRLRREPATYRGKLEAQ